MKIDDLSPNKKNPRKMSKQKRAELKASLVKFGDLSGIIFNEQDGLLYGGHQRRDSLKGAKITLTKKYDKPTKTGTVGEGYAELDGERYAFRQVSWDTKTASEALLAANKIQGEWDGDLLKVMAADIPGLDFKASGFGDDDFKKFDLPIFAETEEEEGGMFASKEPSFDGEPGEESDEDYVKNTPQSTESVPTQSFDNTNEETKIANQKFLIVIDCPSKEIKESLKEKLRPELTQAGCKIF